MDPLNHTASHPTGKESLSRAATTQPPSSRWWRLRHRPRHQRSASHNPDADQKNGVLDHDGDSLGIHRGVNRTDLVAKPDDRGDSFERGLEPGSEPQESHDALQDLRHVSRPLATATDSYAASRRSSGTSMPKPSERRRRLSSRADTITAAATPLLASPTSSHASEASSSSNGSAATTSPASAPRRSSGGSLISWSRMLQTGPVSVSAPVSAPSSPPLPPIPSRRCSDVSGTDRPTAAMRAVTAMPSVATAAQPAAAASSATASTTTRRFVSPRPRLFRGLSVTRLRTTSASAVVTSASASPPSPATLGATRATATPPSTPHSFASTSSTSLTASSGILGLPSPLGRSHTDESLAPASALPPAAPGSPLPTPTPTLTPVSSSSRADGWPAAKPVARPSHRLRRLTSASSLFASRGGADSTGAASAEGAPPPPAGQQASRGMVASPRFAPARGTGGTTAPGGFRIPRLHALRQSEGLDPAPPPTVPTAPTSGTSTTGMAGMAAPAAEPASTAQASGLGGGGSLRSPSPARSSGFSWRPAAFTGKLTLPPRIGGSTSVASASRGSPSAGAPSGGSTPATSPHDVDSLAWASSPGALATPPLGTASASMPWAWGVSGPTSPAARSVHSMHSTRWDDPGPPVAARRLPIGSGTAGPTARGRRSPEPADDASLPVPLDEAILLDPYRRTMRRFLTCSDAMLRAAPAAPAAPTLLPPRPRRGSKTSRGKSQRTPAGVDAAVLVTPGTAPATAAAASGGSSGGWMAGASSPDGEGHGKMGVGRYFGRRLRRSSQSSSYRGKGRDGELELKLPRVSTPTLMSTTE
ncbi:hypothetical protein CXG81DRAFT_20375 [Caulochytrium protostelioides]|uniref:Uncharacterized protein n=1 Tax=Caulochytrium protostelioides TaxID=1555241 RepID=A0A4P9X3F5_9FUNG|nr:hypothetical protein CXG81DRAFT_20375 [Caulochytrium protostelioides]|eukprot:RKO99556.1 hypothetical protein CXG81DRAFT_20375 [Caulochytrium protostelioides]